MRVTRLAIASMGLVALSYFGGVGNAQEVRPPATLWTFLGFPPAHTIKDNLANRSGKHPGLERKPPRLAIADPKNLKSPVPAIKTAAEVKTQEDLAPQKIKAIKYLATIGCGCYNRDGSITEALLAALDDCTETVRLAAADAISATAGDVCENCGQNSCCSKEIHDRLTKMAYETDKDGCWIEPSDRVRRAAARALLACPPQDEVENRGRELPPGEREIPPGTEVIPPAPTPAPPAPMPTSAEPLPAEPSLQPLPDESSKGRDVRQNALRGRNAEVESARKAIPSKDDVPPQLKSSRRTAQLGLLQATPVASHRESEPETPAELSEGGETIRHLPAVDDVEPMVALPAPAMIPALIVDTATVDFIDRKQRLVVVRTSEGQLSVGATVQASHRFLTGPAVVGQLKVVASEPGTAILKPINGMSATRVAQGDQVTVIR